MPPQRHVLPVSEFDFSACSHALNRELAITGARALAAALVRPAHAPAIELAGASAGASAAFTELCLALAEAPAGPEFRQIEVAGLGRVAWRACPERDPARGELVVFALHDADGSTIGPIRAAFDFDHRPFAAL